MMDDDDEVISMKRTGTARLLKAAGVLAVVPFIAHVQVNGLDYIKLGLGLAACVMVVVAGARLSPEEKQLKSGFGLGGLTLLVAAFHIVTSGIFG